MTRSRRRKQQGLRIELPGWRLRLREARRVPERQGAEPRYYSSVRYRKSCLGGGEGDADVGADADGTFCVCVPLIRSYCKTRSAGDGDRGEEMGRADLIGHGDGSVQSGPRGVGQFRAARGERCHMFALSFGWGVRTASMGWGGASRCIRTVTAPADAAADAALAAAASDAAPAADGPSIGGGWEG